MNIRTILLLSLLSISLHSAEKLQESVNSDLDTVIQSTYSNALKAQHSLATLKPGEFIIKPRDTNTEVPPVINQTSLQQSDINNVQEGLEQNGQALATWVTKLQIYQRCEKSAAPRRSDQPNPAMVTLAKIHYNDFKHRIALDLSPQYTDEQAQQEGINSAQSYLPSVCIPNIMNALRYVQWFIDLTDVIVSWQPVVPAQTLTAPATAEQKNTEPHPSRMNTTLQTLIPAVEHQTFEAVADDLNKNLATFNGHFKDYMVAASQCTDERSRHNAFVFIKQAAARINSLKIHINNEIIRQKTLARCKKQLGETQAIECIEQAYYKDFTNRLDETASKLFTPEEALKASKEVAQSYLPIHSKAKLHLSSTAIHSLAQLLRGRTNFLQDANQKAPTQPDQDQAQLHAMLVKTLD